MRAIDALRQALIGLTVQADMRATIGDSRNLVAMAAKALRISPDKFNEALAGMMAMEEAQQAEAATWIEADAVRAGESGPFDACDLEIWLAVAERFGVATVPGEVILRLDSEESAAVSGSIQMPEGPAAKIVQTALRAIATQAGIDPDAIPEKEGREIDMEDLVERLHAAMDGVPEGWMVRTAACGGSELKALAGTGLAGTTAPEVRFGNDLEIGPGWIRHGNRRMVNTKDHRTVELTARRPREDMVFIARPWVEASRYFVAEDPHRHGSPFQGPGRWPAEWRAFVVDGKVSGVSSYYGWAGEMTPENARKALEVRDVAQGLVDQMMAAKLYPRIMDVEWVRNSPALAQHPEMAAEIARHGRETVSCSMDFIETAQGLLFLEAGPGNSPVGGAHVCSFAGNGMTGKFDGVQVARSTVGVAFRPMAHVSIAESKTWKAGDRTGAIATWEEAEALARGEAPVQVEPTPAPKGFLHRILNR